MPLTAQQTRLARTMDRDVAQVLAHSGDDEVLLLSLADDMPTFKQRAGMGHLWWLELGLAAPRFTPRANTVLAAPRWLTAVTGQATLRASITSA